MPEPVRSPFDVIVVGGSFAGLSAAMQLGRARRRVLLVDSGQPRNRFAAASHGLLGQDGRTPAEILAVGRQQVLAYPTVTFKSAVATAASAESGIFHVALESGESVVGRRVILATGVTDELPALAGLRERWGATVLHCPYCHGYEVADQRLGVLAFSEGNVHQALLLPDWSADVTLFTNDSVQLGSDLQATLLGRGVKLEHRRVVRLAGQAPGLEGVVVRADDSDILVPLDALFVATRTRMSSPLAQQFGCAFDEGPFGPVIRTDLKKQTTVPGVFAAGDAARAPHNVTWASADGVTAGIYAHQSLALEKR